MKKLPLLSLKESDSDIKTFIYSLVALLITYSVDRPVCDCDITREKISNSVLLNISLSTLFL